MIVFHGSYIIVDKPSISFSRENLDFGKGFYVIELEQQAVSWARRYSKKDEKTYVSEYALEDDIYKISKVLRFDNYTEKWFDYIVKCRNGCDIEEYDVVCGPVANDRVFNTCELFFKKIN